MKRLLTLLLAVAAAWLVYPQFPTSKRSPSAEPPATYRDVADIGGAAQIERAAREQRGNLQVEVQASVSKLLKDDNNGSRHQRFIVSLSSGHTLLVAHNIDLAARINNLQPGDAVTIYGEYEWNPQGGVMHWTHRDPAGRHIAGWIKHNGHVYQ